MNDLAGEILFAAYTVVIAILGYLLVSGFLTKRWFLRDCTRIKRSPILRMNFRMPRSETLMDLRIRYDLKGNDDE
jgi:hypothetical protein